MAGMGGVSTPYVRRAAGASGILAFLACGVSSAPALAAGPTPAATSGDADKQALELFEKSKVSYQAGRFQEAVTLLKEAYAKKPVPVLLYNLGRAYEGLGDQDAALQAYTDYLAADPKAPDRGAIETRIATLKQQIDERERLKQEREAAEAKAAQAPVERRAPVVPWIVAGVGGAGVVTGVVFGVLAVSKHNSATNDPVQASAAQEQSDAKTFATVANVAWVAGGVVAVTGIVWGILASRHPSTPSEKPASVSLVPVVSPGRFEGVALEGRLF